MNPYKYDWVREFINLAENFDEDENGVPSHTDYVKQFVPHYSNLMTMLGTGQFKSYDVLLSSIDTTAFCTTSLIALLRLSYSYKHNLCSWQPFYDRVHGELTDRELPADELLNGLV